MTKSLIEKAFYTNSLSKDELVSVLSDNSINETLFDFANKTREKNFGNKIYLRGLAEISNICSKNCLYCGLRKDNKNIKRYKLSEKQILEYVENAIRCGLKTIVLQAGESPCYSQKEIISLIREIKKFDLALTLSLGEKNFEEYKSYKNAGADRYLIRIETSDKSLYQKFHPNMSFENRIECIKTLKNLGFETGTGTLVGLKGQTPGSLADDILFFKEIDADMVGLGIFITNPDTPLKNDPNGDFILTLKMLSLTRLLLPTSNIPATTAMETFVENGQIMALNSGANVIMPNICDCSTDEYKLYPDKFKPQIPLSQYIDELSRKVETIGRQLSFERGNRKQ